MLYSFSGKLVSKKLKSIVIESLGFGLEFIVSPKTIRQLPKINSRVKIFCTPRVNKEGAELYGFLTEDEKNLFDIINSAPGIGPKSALGLLAKFSRDKLFSMISNNRADLLAQAGGMGQKRSERLIVELKNRIKKLGNGNLDSLEEDLEIIEVLKALGYKQKEISEVLKKVPEGPMKLEDRLKMAFKFLIRR